MMGCLYHAFERAYYFKLTLAGLFHESFACKLASFEYHFSLHWSLLENILIFLTKIKHPTFLFKSIFLKKKNYLALQVY